MSFPIIVTAEEVSLIIINVSLPYYSNLKKIKPAGNFTSGSLNIPFEL